MVKRLSAVLVALVLSASCFCGMSASAAQIEPDVSINTVYASDFDSELTITGTTAKCVSTAEGKTAVTSIVINQTLQKQLSTGKWQFIEHWNGSFTGSSATLTNTRANLESGTYRIYTQITLSTANDFEVLTKYSTSKTL